MHSFYRLELPSGIFQKERLYPCRLGEGNVSYEFLDTENHTQLTKTGEHITGGSFIDPILQQKPKIRDVRSDIYSVGAIWYFLLCGRAPSGSDMREYLEKSNSQITPTDIDIIMKCLSSSIENRYSSCEELLPIVKNAAMG